MKKLLSVILVLVMLFTFAACMSGDTNRVKSTESKISLNFPSTWIEMDLNPIATIQMGLGEKEQFFMVIEEPFTDFESGTTVLDYAELVRDHLVNNTGAASTPSLKKVTIAKNITGQQFELAVEFEEMNITYYITCIEGDGHFYQLFSWSLDTTYKAAKVEFNKILDSVKFSK